MGRIRITEAGNGKRHHHSEVPAKCRDCMFYVEQQEHAELMQKAFGTYPQWDYQTCNFACVKEGKFGYELSHSQYYNGHKIKNDAGYRGRGRK